MKSEELRSCPFLIDFLKINDHKVFEKKAKEYEKIVSKGISLKDFVVLGGQAKLVIESDVINFFKKGSDIANHYSLLYHEIVETAKDI